MSKIDKAFVKAFAKERPPAPQAEPAAVAVDLAALGMSSFWIDPSNNDLMRMDAAQSQPLRKPVTGRQRGTRPVASRRPASSTPPIPPSAEASPETSSEHSIELLRIDAAQPEPPPEHVFRTRLDASSFPAITVTHDSIEDPTEVLERPYAPAPAAETTPVTTPAPIADAAPVGEAKPVGEAAPVGEHQRPPAPTAAAPQASPTHSVVTSEAVAAAAEPIAAPVAETAAEPPATVAFPGPIEQAAAQPAVTETPTSNQATRVPAAPVAPFEAAWEVDEFETPAIIDQLLTNGGMIAGAGVPMAQAAQDGMQRVLITSPHRGAGRSTLAIGLALAAATTGIRVALVDGDWNHPTLVDDLQLDLEFGWPEAIRGGVALSETAVHSVGDGVTLFPIVSSTAGLPPQTEELQQTIDQLTEHFDLIIVDGPSADVPMPHNCFQSGIIVRDLRNFDKAAIDDSIAALRAAGIAQVGVAENFAN